MKIRKSSNNSTAHALHFDAAQGAGEQQTEPYIEYGEGAEKPATQRSAKSTEGVFGPAGNAIGAVHGVSVKAGFPNPAAEQLLDNPDFNRLLVRHPASTFCMRLNGNDWQDQGIFSGDIAVVDRALNPGKTSLVIWWEEDFKIGKFNKVPLDTPIWGVVTAIIHRPL